MERITMKKYTTLWSLAVGAMDASTGLLLVFAPQFTLKLMKIPPLDPAAWVFLQWIGAFVGAVGLSYLFALRSDQERAVVWKITALVRLVIAAFLVVIIWLRSEKKEAVA
jgi:H+/Cl- antiporter ClcA